jgi:hypothetical protein
VKSTALALLVFAAPAPAHAAEVTLGLFGGLENGAVARVSSADHRYSAELLEILAPPSRSTISELSLVVRTSSASTGFLGARLGYQLAVLNYVDDGPPDVAHTIDAGMVFGASRGHSSLTFEVGLEQVLRAHAYYCCDSGVQQYSTGARGMLAAELGLGAYLSLLARIGIRTADHLAEIHLEPFLFAGAAVSF